MPCCCICKNTRVAKIFSCKNCRGEYHEYCFQRWNILNWPALLGCPICRIGSFTPPAPPAPPDRPEIEFLSADRTPTPPPPLPPPRPPLPPSPPYYNNEEMEGKLIIDEDEDEDESLQENNEAENVSNSTVMESKPSKSSSSRAKNKKVYIIHKALEFMYYRIMY